MNEKEEVKLLSVETSRHGVIRYSPSDVIKMVRPILGLGDLHNFLLFGDDEIEPFLWFQSIESPSISFVLLDVGIVDKDYHAGYCASDFVLLDASSLSDCLEFFLVVVGSSIEQSTVNMKAPILINNKSKKAIQVIVDNDNYGVKTPIFK